MEKVIVSRFQIVSFLNSEEYGWEYDTNNNFYAAVLTDQLPVPKHITELCIGKCNTGCDSL